MRPIDKGPTPTVKGKIKKVSDYTQWRADLLDRLGPYCCYCNIRLSDSIQVEHVVAQSKDISSVLDWDNLLLSCAPCNRAKSNQDCSYLTHYLPQYHNTHLAFIYYGEKPFTRPRDSVENKNKSENTIALFSLDRDTSRDPNRVTDLRWKFRRSAILYARICRQDWRHEWGEERKSEYVRHLKIMVEGHGFWSVWYDAFFDVPEVVQMLVKDFPGTNRRYFDEVTFSPISGDDD